MPDIAATAAAAINLSPEQAHAAQESSNRTNAAILEEASGFAANMRQALHEAKKSPEVNSSEDLKESAGLCEHMVGLLEEQIKNLKELQQNNPHHSLDSPGKEKTLASSIKKMFKGIGSVGATGLMVFSGVAFSLALITGQVYALPLLAMMTAVGYVAVHMLLDEEAENNQPPATPHAA